MTQNQADTGGTHLGPSRVLLIKTSIKTNCHNLQYLYQTGMFYVFAGRPECSFMMGR